MVAHRTWHTKCTHAFRPERRQLEAAQHLGGSNRQRVVDAVQGGRTENERGMTGTGRDIGTHETQWFGNPIHRTPTKTLAPVKGSGRTGRGKRTGEQTERRGRIAAVHQGDILPLPP